MDIPGLRASSKPFLTAVAGRAVLARAMAAAVLAGALAAGGVAAQEKPASRDDSITVRVEKVIAQDASLKAMDITVRTSRGVVSLSGHVRSLEDAARAGEVARAVSGVSAVKNGLRVADRPSRA